jgi:hypothetical protein
MHDQPVKEISQDSAAATYVVGFAFFRQKGCQQGLFDYMPRKAEYFNHNRISDIQSIAGPSQYIIIGH